MNWAWARLLPPSAKLILMSLADAADESGLCWPRIKVIAEKCCVSERTVQRAIKDFERDHMLIVQRHYRDDGSQASNRYQLCMEAAPDMVSPRDGSPKNGCRHGVTGDCQPRHGASDMAASPQEPPTEPSIETTTTFASRAEPGVCANLVVPRRLPQGDKPGIMTLLREVPEADAQMLLDELEAALEFPGTIKTTPGRWFYGLVQRYAQGKFNPVGATLVAARRAKANAPVKVERRAAVDPEVARAHIAKIAASLHVATEVVK